MDTIINQEGVQDALNAIQDREQAVEKRRELAISFISEANEADKKLGGATCFPHRRSISPNFTIYRR